MELWIRSQDKEILIKTNELEIEANMIIGFINNIADFRYLGAYATKERALEVLDEIQNKLKGTFLLKAKSDEYEKTLPMVKEYFEKLNSVCIVSGDNNYDIEPINKDIYVYEMPEK